MEVKSPTPSHVWLVAWKWVTVTTPAFFEILGFFNQKHLWVFKWEMRKKYHSEFVLFTL